MEVHQVSTQPEVAAPVIVADGLSKSYDDTVAVDNLSFEVHPGSILALLGPNGAGKTTTINMLTTLLPIDEGRASIAGIDVTAQPDVARGLIGLAGQSAAVDEKLTARENLDLFGRLYKIRKAQRQSRTHELIERFRMTDYADRTVDTYSGGQRRRLDVVASLIANPPALFLDEPTTGLDPRSRTELWGEIRRLADQGAAVVLTTQYLDEADQLADWIAVIDEGVIAASGTARQLKDDLEQDVLEIHLENLVHPRALDHYPAVQGEGASGEPRPRAARDERDTEGAAGLDDPCDLGLLPGQHHGAGSGAVKGKAVGLVDEEIFGAHQAGIVSDDGAE